MDHVNGENGVAHHEVVGRERKINELNVKHLLMCPGSNDKHVSSHYGFRLCLLPWMYYSQGKK